MEYTCVLYLLLCYVCVIFGQDPACSGRDQCSCVTTDNQVIDLSSLGKTDGNAMFPDLQAPDGYMYSYNPCYPFTEIQCVDQAVCQVPVDRTTSYPAGDAVSAVFSNDGINNRITYSSTDGAGTTRQSQVTLVCDPSASTPVMTPLGEQGSSIYYLTLTSKCCCPGGCADGPPPTGPGPTKKPGEPGEIDGLSIGSILCIVVLCVGVVYLIGGVLFMKFGKQASGADLMPNKKFWSGVPTNIKTGFQFTYGKVRGKSSAEYSSI
ncbi:uncharacterized protein LOC134704905 [Mytilus trossulus]|uniref:uncharacterized protein LOC134704905 n=1 Tax=Mytilus trossulus TaxID=6551 RepID=UPI00300746CB